MRTLVTLVILLGLGACEQTDKQAIVYYNFSGLKAPPQGNYYEHFVVLDELAVSLGTFMVEDRQTNCFDLDGMGRANIRPAVVACTPPCTKRQENPCKQHLLEEDLQKQPTVLEGTVIGVVDHANGPVTSGGVEIATEISLTHATSIFLTRELGSDPDPAPSFNIVLEGTLVPDGPVLRGILAKKGLSGLTGKVTIVPIHDEVSL
jgi:hypothetical protein